MEPLDLFIRDTRTTHRGRTADTYRFPLARLIGWMERGSVAWEELTPATFDAFILEQAGWGQSTRYLALAAAKAYIRWAGYGEAHPLLAHSYKKAEPQSPAVIDEDQAFMLLSAIDTSSAIGTRNLAIVCLMLDTGLREAEVCAADIGNLYLGDRFLITRVRGELMESASFSEYTASCLAAWLRVRGTLLVTNRALFIDLDAGQPLSVGAIRKMLTRLAHKAGFEDGISPRVLRRSFAVIMANAGANSLEIQAAGRWADGREVERLSRAAMPGGDFTRFSPVQRVLSL